MLMLRHFIYPHHILCNERSAVKSDSNGGAGEKKERKKEAGMNG